MRVVLPITVAELNVQVQVWAFCPVELAWQDHLRTSICPGGPGGWPLLPCLVALSIFVQPTGSLLNLSRPALVCRRTRATRSGSARRMNIHFFQGFQDKEPQCRGGDVGENETSSLPARETTGQG